MFSVRAPPTLLVRSLRGCYRPRSIVAPISTLVQLNAKDTDANARHKNAVTAFAKQNNYVHQRSRIHTSALLRASMDEEVKTRAIVTYDTETWKMEDLVIKELGDEELLVDMVASGICHTDLVDVGSHLPAVLGHEGSGYVRKVGSKVTVAKPGDAVLLSFASCRECLFCHDNHPAHCVSFAPLNFGTIEEDYTRADNSIVNGSFFGQSSFAKTARVKQSSVVTVTDKIRNEDELKLFSPLGCGFQTGSGTLRRIGQATPNDTVAILGLGGVGLSAVMAAKLVGCRAIIAIDILDARCKLAEELGATHGVNSKNLGDMSLGDRVREITDGLGASIVVDTTGVMDLIEQAVQFTRIKGTFISIAAAPFEANFKVNAVELTVTGKRIMGGVEGDAIPSIAIPEMIDWFRQGKFPIDKLIKFYPAEEYQKAVDDMKKGETIKPVLVW